ncbi:hypothetical protein ACLB2K_063673 [Fragaria x ananassa]
MHILQHFPDSYDPELHLLARGPQSHRVRTGCFVNGVKFVTSERDEGHITQNNGIMVEGLGFNYYRVLVSVIELIYGKVDSNSVWYENEPFILATMTKQVFYLDDSAMEIPKYLRTKLRHSSAHHLCQLPRPIEDPIHPSVTASQPRTSTTSTNRHWNCSGTPISMLPPTHRLQSRHRINPKSPILRSVFNLSYAPFSL